LVYGAKKWLLYPPSNMIMSSMQIREFLEKDMADFAARGVKPTTCVQLAGVYEHEMLLQSCYLPVWCD
jgi:hypothetical protein